MKLLFLVLVGVQGLSCLNQDVDSNLFLKSKYSCECETGKGRNTFFVRQSIVEKRDSMNVVNLELRDKNKTIVDNFNFGVFKNKFYIIDSLKSELFIDLDKQENKYTFFSGALSLGGASYIFRDTTNLDSNYKKSVHFEGTVVNSKVISQFDLNKSLKVYQFYYFDGAKGYKCK